MNWFVIYPKFINAGLKSRPPDFQTFDFQTRFERPLSSGETDRVHREVSQAIQRCHISLLAVA